MKQANISKLNFDKNFLWGAATSAHQVEGNTHNQWTVWELENAQEMAKNAAKNQTWLPNWQQRVKVEATNPENYVSGLAADHYNRYQQDFDLLQKLNMNAFRFSIEWSRIEPEEGKWDMAEIEHYRQYIKELKSRGIEPLVTLMHWTLPVWFTDKGGFEKRKNVKYFVRYAEKILQELGADMRYICTINEPEVYVGNSYYMGIWPPGKHSGVALARVYYNLAYAHNQVVKAGRKISRRFKFSVSKNCAHHWPGDDKLLSKISAWIATWAADYIFLYYIKKQIDWLGLNYYFSNRYIGMEIKNLNENVNDLGWEMRPKDMQPVIERLYKKYKLPIIITESGVADSQDEHRQWWIQESILAMQRAQNNGAQVIGYLHWSLLDNFEWAFGKWPRFGLVHVDYKTFKRTPRKSALWFGAFVKKIQRDA